MKKNYIIAATIVCLLIIFLISMAKKINYGNNIINKSTDDCVDYILNMKSYRAIAEVTINSNKNSNTYLMKQEYREGYSSQEILSEGDILGVKIVNEGKKLKVINTSLNLEKIYDDYSYITDNSLFLSTFVQEYIESSESKYYEKNEDIILETKVTNMKNKYTCYKKLYVDRNTNKVSKIEIKDSTQKGTIYILYRDIEIDI